MILTEKELTQSRLTLIKHLEAALQELIEEHRIEVGYWGTETVSLMADASIIVIKATADLNTYLETGGHLKT